MSICEEMIFDFICLPFTTTAADVSSQLVSTASIVIFPLSAAPALPAVSPVFLSIKENTCSFRYTCFY
jgi:hypothetical protein